MHLLWPPFPDDDRFGGLAWGAAWCCGRSHITVCRQPGNRMEIIAVDYISFPPWGRPTRHAWRPRHCQPRANLQRPLLLYPSCNSRHPPLLPSTVQCTSKPIPPCKRLPPFYPIPRRSQISCPPLLIIIHPPPPPAPPPLFFNLFRPCSRIYSSRQSKGY